MWFLSNHSRFPPWRLNYTNIEFTTLRAGINALVKLKHPHKSDVLWCLRWRSYGTIEPNWLAVRWIKDRKISWRWFYSNPKPNLLPIDKMFAEPYGYLEP